MSYIHSYRTEVGIGICILMLQGAALSAQQNPATAAGTPAPSAATSTSSQAPVAEIDAIAYANLRNNAQQIYDAIKDVPRKDTDSKGFVIYDRQLFSQLPTYLPAVREVDQIRRNLCYVKDLPSPTQPPEKLSNLAPTLDVGTALSGIASLLGVFKPGLSITAMELPPSDQVLIADFANVAQRKGTAVYIPGVFLPNLEPDPDPLETDQCPKKDAVLLEKWNQASLLQEWRAAGKVADQVAKKLNGLTDLKDTDPPRKQLKDALDAYSATLKKYTTTDASGGSPLASLVAAGRLQLLLELKKHPLILVLAADDVGGAGFVQSKPFTVPVAFSGGANAHYFVFDSGLDSRVVAAGSVTSFNTQLDSKTMDPPKKIAKDFDAKLKKSRIQLPSPQ